MTECSIDGCNNLIVARGWCSKHYARWKKYGDPETVRQSQMHGVSVLERFMANVAVSDGCWEWSGHTDVNGYGRLRVNGVPVLAHRLSWQFDKGITLSSKTHILHKCDNPACVRPSHLFSGDQADNMADKMKKGRHVYGVSKGEAHGCSKLTEKDVMEIRASSETGVSLARKYGVSNTQISDIRNRRSWRHIP